MYIMVGLQKYIQVSKINEEIIAFIQQRCIELIKWRYKMLSINFNKNICLWELAISYCGFAPLSVSSIRNDIKEAICGLKAELRCHVELADIIGGNISLVERKGFLYLLFSSAHPRVCDTCYNTLEIAESDFQSGVY